MAMPYAGITLSTVTNPAWSNDGWQTKDYAFYTLSPHTTERVVYIENGRDFTDGSRNYINGIVSTYYEIDYPKQPVIGQYICKSGASTALTCGYVTTLNYTDNKYSNLVRISKSVQPYIGAGGDSGAPVFTWRPDGSMVYPNGIAIGASIIETVDQYGNVISSRDCKNTSSTASNNNTCHVVFLPLTTIRGYAPFTINTVNGFLAP